VERESSSKPYPDGTGIGSSRSGASGDAARAITSTNTDQAVSAPAIRL
jgi:hypothetical protein